MSLLSATTNMPALTAHRGLMQGGRHQQTTVERLAGGLRINRAADDAAGLAISEGMRNQIRGLDQATRNTQDGISLIQTAEGALEEVHRLLERVRVLTNQASNDTNSAQERRMIFTEVDQLLQEIERISTDTHFNNIPLLTGQPVNPLSLTMDELGIQGLNFAQDMQNAINNHPGLANLPGTILSFMTYTPAPGGMFHFNFDSAGISAMLQTILDDILTAVPGATFNNNLQQIVNSLAIAYSTNPLPLSPTAIAAGFAATLMEDIFNASHFTAPPPDSGPEPGPGPGPTDPSQPTPPGNQDREALHFEIQTGANSGQRVGIKLRRMDLSGLDLNDFSQDFLVAIDSAQAGAQLSSLIEGIDHAVSLVSHQRTELGATQNRLEHTITNLRVSSENLSAANSRIRDADMAAEMVALSRQQVLQQASTSMLAQSRGITQNMIDLLAV